jgi:hypothetical protein
MVPTKIANMLKAQAPNPKDASFADFDAATAAAPTGLVMAAALIAEFTGLPIIT